MSEPDLPPEAFAAALAGFRGMTVHRLLALLRHHEPEEAWRVVQGLVPARGLVASVLAHHATGPALRTAWAASARERTPDRVWAECRGLGVSVLIYGWPGYPALLLDDPLPPPVLFVRGHPELLHGRRVGIVGTRNATSAGRQAASALGEGLGSAGVHVVSGLARGIDGYAHRGVLAAEGEGRPIAVVASGLDVVYPREHRDLWAATANCGLLLSEAPPGTPPEAYRFPLRNRIVAALSEAVVVVESREKGGSLITVAEALDRAVPVMAVPGPVSGRASAGTNSLLRDGAAPVLGAADVLSVLALDHRRSDVRVAVDQRRRPTGSDLVVYRLLGAEPRTLDALVLLSGLALGEAAMSLARLTAEGWVAEADGWFERVGTPLR
jgi:DNA processing protein